jgi:hypothetical protein
MYKFLAAECRKFVRNIYVGTSKGRKTDDLDAGPGPGVIGK